MWIERRLPRLRQHRALGLISAAALVTAAIALRLLLPHLPPFLTFFPAVLLETRGGSPLAPLAALAATGVLTWRLTRPRAAVVPGRSAADDTVPRQAPSASARGDLLERPRMRDTAGHVLRAALAAAYATTAARPCFHATLNPSPPLTQRAVGAGIRAMIPLQAALSARAGAPAAALLTAALAPLAAKFGRKVSLT